MLFYCQATLNTYMGTVMRIIMAVLGVRVMELDYKVINIWDYNNDSIIISFSCHRILN